MRLPSILALTVFLASCSSYGPDADLASPMSVTMEGEGMYGFRIVLQSGVAVEFPPQNGDRPENQRCRGLSAHRVR